MSEYQYYKFQAIDRPTRSSILPTEVLLHPGVLVALEAAPRVVVDEARRRDPGARRVGAQLPHLLLGQRPVPVGLSQLSASLKGLVEFLRVDSDLLQVAAKASSPLPGGTPKPAEIRAWLSRLPPAEKDDLLARLIVGNDGALAAELLQRLERDRGGNRKAGKAASKRRTVRELLHEAEQAALRRGR
ncbi:MAG: hypothetical protein ACREUD_07705 [Gammaproteobacteria bacterium]